MALFTIGRKRKSTLPLAEESCRFRTGDSGRYVLWEISRFCNLECLHCCTLSGPKISTAGDVSRERALAIARELSDVAIESVLFSGGEPLLRRDFFEIVDAIDKDVTRVFLASNGTLIDGPMAERIRASGIYQVDISLDGHTADLHNAVRVHPSAFDRALNGIRACVAAGIRLRVPGMITPANCEHVVEFIGLLVSLGVKRTVVSSIVSAAGRAKENPSLVLPRELVPRTIELVERARSLYGNQISIDQRLTEETQEQKGCAAGEKFLHVSPDGDVSGCSWLYKSDPNRFCLGNIKESSLASCLVRNSQLMQSLRQITDWCPIPYVEAGAI